MPTPEQILSTNDERVVIVHPERMLGQIANQVAASSDVLSVVMRTNVGNITRVETLAILNSCRKALAAAQGLDDWRKKNPHPDDQTYG